MIKERISVVMAVMMTKLDNSGVMINTVDNNTNEENKTKDKKLSKVGTLSEEILEIILEKDSKINLIIGNKISIIGQFNNNNKNKLALNSDCC